MQGIFKESRKWSEGREKNCGTRKDSEVARMLRVESTRLGGRRVLRTSLASGTLQPECSDQSNVSAFYAKQDNDGTLFVTDVS